MNHEKNWHMMSGIDRTTGGSYSLMIHLLQFYIFQRNCNGPPDVAVLFEVLPGSVDQVGSELLFGAVMSHLHLQCLPQIMAVHGNLK